MVHPDQRRQGLGSQLLTLVRSHLDANTHHKDILVYANGHNSASLAFLKHHGFEVAGTSGALVAPVTDLPQAKIPASFSLRCHPELGNPQILVQALNECYKDQVGHHQNVTGEVDQRFGVLYNQGEHWFPLAVGFVVVNKSYQIYQCPSH